MQTTSGRSPDFEMNSKSSRMTRVNGSSVTVTAGPFLDKHMLRAVDQPALVAERHAKKLGGLELGKLRVAKSAGRRGEALVCAVLLVGIHPHPAVDAVDKGHLLRAG